mmetsp:Transcript_11973/g.24379  ORF Transcript_11973/g.24379 Transcript_11973/m.24379 type:complete len:334 (-) Transcript_11973:1258-2259(-)
MSPLPPARSSQALPSPLKHPACTGGMSARFAASAGRPSPQVTTPKMMEAAAAVATATCSSFVVSAAGYPPSALRRASTVRQVWAPTRRGRGKLGHGIGCPGTTKAIIFAVTRDIRCWARTRWGDMDNDGVAASEGYRSVGSVGILEFLLLCGRLKTTKRAGWLYHGVDLPESISDHMYRMAIMAMLVPSHLGLRSERLVKLALVHDMAEAVVGDITPRDGVPKAEKHHREKKVVLDIRDRILANSAVGEEIFDLWMEYETGATDEARVVKDIDKLELLVQAFEYETAQGHDLSEFFDSVRGKLSTPIVLDWAKELEKLRIAREPNPDVNRSLD